jgi:hypothetical protein
MYEYSGKIFCLHCSGKFRGKMQRTKKVYICGTRNKRSDECVRFVLEENEINDVIKRHYKIMKERVEVTKIEVEPVSGKILFCYANGHKYIVEQNSIGEFVSSV